MIASHDLRHGESVDVRVAMSAHDAIVYGQAASRRWHRAVLRATHVQRRTHDDATLEDVLVCEYTRHEHPVLKLVVPRPVLAHMIQHTQSFAGLSLRNLQRQHGGHAYAIRKPHGE